jgi:ribosomal protein L37AE/L43A
MEKKFCVSCQVIREAEGFKLVLRNKTKVWKCAVCLKRQSDQQYRSKTNGR